MNATNWLPIHYCIDSGRDPSGLMYSYAIGWLGDGWRRYQEDTRFLILQMAEEAKTHLTHQVFRPEDV